MDKKDTIGAELAPLFRLSRDAVCGIARGRVVFANPAACRMFGTDITGEASAERFPGLDGAGQEDGFAASVMVGGAPRCATGAYCGETLVLTIQREEPVLPPVPPTALRQMRSATLNLRLSLDRVVSGVADEQGTYAAILFRSYYSLLHITNQFSDVNALAEGNMACRMQPLSFTKLLRELTDSVRFFLHGKNVTLECHLPEEEVFVMGDREKLEQLLLILFSNSLSHTGTDGAVLTLRLQKHDEQCHLALTDNGTIPENELAEAFAVQTEDTLSLAQGGRLGIPIAQGLAQLHGGLLVIESGVNSGSGVHLQLPVTDALALRDAVPRDAGPDIILTELCDFLPLEAYAKEYRE